MAERSYRWLLWGLVLLGTGLDQGSKYGVFKWLYNGGKGGSCGIVPGAFELLAQYQERPDVSAALSVDRGLAALQTWSGATLPKVNHGALFGLGGEYETLANGLFALVSIVAALAIAYWSTRPATARDRFLCAALGLILAGTLGNLYDRLVFNGVRDFLHFHFHSFEWPVFNVADCCLVCGACLLLLQAFCARPASAASEAAEMAVSAAPAEAK